MSYDNKSNGTIGYNIIDCAVPVPREVLQEINEQRRGDTNPHHPPGQIKGEHDMSRTVTEKILADHLVAGN